MDALGIRVRVSEETRVRLDVEQIEQARDFQEVREAAEATAQGTEVALKRLLRERRIFLTLCV